MSATEELLRLRYNLNVLADTWAKEAKDMDAAINLFIANNDQSTASHVDAAAVQLRYRIKQLKDILDA